MNRLLTTLFLLLAGFSNGHAGHVSANNAILNEYDQETDPEPGWHRWRQRLPLLLQQYGITILQLITQPITTNMRRIFTQLYLHMRMLANGRYVTLGSVDNSLQSGCYLLPITVHSPINKPA